MAKLSLYVVALFVAAVAQLAHAQSANEVSSTLTVNHVVAQPDGKEVSEPAKTAKPGDVLEYIAEYRNSGSGTAKKLEATLPIPLGTEYIPNSANPAGALASVDGTIFEPAPLKRKVKQADGTLVEQPVPLAEYRFIRWQPQDLPAGKSLKYSARAKMSTDAPAPPSAPGKK